MRSLPSSEHSRTFVVEDIPADLPGVKNTVGRLAVTVGYEGASSALKAIALDHAVVPLFKAAPAMQIAHVAALDCISRLDRYGEYKKLTESIADTISASEGIDRT